MNRLARMYSLPARQKQNIQKTKMPPTAILPHLKDIASLFFIIAERDKKVSSQSSIDMHNFIDRYSFYLDWNSKASLSQLVWL